MKKSEARAVIQTATTAANAETILERLEERGQKWDPEEPELPGRLWITPNEAYIREEGDAWRSPFLAIISPDGCWDPAFAPREVCLATAREAVRRYNLIPEIHAKLAGAVSPDTKKPWALVREALALMLDGKEPS